MQRTTTEFFDQVLLLAQYQKNILHKWNCRQTLLLYCKDYVKYL